MWIYLFIGALLGIVFANDEEVAKDLSSFEIFFATITIILFWLPVLIGILLKKVWRDWNGEIKNE